MRAARSWSPSREIGRRGRLHPATQPRPTRTSPPRRSTARGTAGSRRRPGGCQYQAGPASAPKAGGLSRRASSTSPMRDALFSAQPASSSRDGRARDCTDRPVRRGVWRIPSRPRLARISAQCVRRAQAGGGRAVVAVWRTAAARRLQYGSTAGNIVTLRRIATCGGGPCSRRRSRSGWLSGS